MWEYRWVRLAPPTDGNIQYPSALVLSIYGEEGWEMVQILPLDQPGWPFIVLMKRQVRRA